MKKLILAIIMTMMLVFSLTFVACDETPTNESTIGVTSVKVAVNKNAPTQQTIGDDSGLEPVGAIVSATTSRYSFLSDTVDTTPDTTTEDTTDTTTEDVTTPTAPETGDGDMGYGDLEVVETITAETIEFQAVEGQDIYLMIEFEEDNSSAIMGAILNGKQYGPLTLASEGSKDNVLVFKLELKDTDGNWLYPEGTHELTLNGLTYLSGSELRSETLNQTININVKGWEDVNFYDTTDIADATPIQKIRVVSGEKIAYAPDHIDNGYEILRWIDEDGQTFSFVNDLVVAPINLMADIAQTVYEIDTTKALADIESIDLGAGEGVTYEAHDLPDGIELNGSELIIKNLTTDTKGQKTALITKTVEGNSYNYYVDFRFLENNTKALSMASGDIPVMYFNHDTSLFNKVNVEFAITNTSSAEQLQYSFDNVNWSDNYISTDGAGNAKATISVSEFKNTTNLSGEHIIDLYVRFVEQDKVEDGIITNIYKASQSVQIFDGYTKNLSRLTYSDYYIIASDYYVDGDKVLVDTIKSNVGHLTSLPANMTLVDLYNGGNGLIDTVGLSALDNMDLVEEIVVPGGLKMSFRFNDENPKRALNDMNSLDTITFDKELLILELYDNSEINIYSIAMFNLIDTDKVTTVKFDGVESEMEELMSNWYSYFGGFIDIYLQDEQPQQ